MSNTATTGYDRTDWAIDELAYINAPDTPSNVQTLVDWATAEGGAGPQWGVADNETDYNPINVSETTGPQGYGYDPGTGKYYAGASPTPGNNPPIAAFSDWATGIEATGDRLEEPFASGILSALQSGAPESTIAAAVGQSGWGTGDFASSGASGGPANGATAGAAGSTSATDTGLNVNPFDLFGIPQTIAGSAASSIWAEVGPFILKTVLVVAGLGIMGLGAWRLVAPEAKGAAQDVSKIAPEAAEVAA